MRNDAGAASLLQSRDGRHGGGENVLIRSPLGAVLVIKLAAAAIGLAVIVAAPAAAQESGALPGIGAQPQAEQAAPPPAEAEPAEPASADAAAPESAAPETSSAAAPAQAAPAAAPEAVATIPVQPQEQPAPVAAEPVGEQPQRIDSIVVTAQKREERLQDVPVAITVINAEQLERTNITQIHDLARVAPSVEVNGQPGNADTRISIRGISTESFSVTAEQAVSIVVDGVVLG